MGHAWLMRPGGCLLAIQKKRAKTPRTREKSANLAPSAASAHLRVKESAESKVHHFSRESPLGERVCVFTRLLRVCTCGKSRGMAMAARGRNPSNTCATRATQAPHQIVGTPKHPSGALEHPSCGLPGAKKGPKSAPRLAHTAAVTTSFLRGG